MKVRSNFNQCPTDAAGPGDTSAETTVAENGLAERLSARSRDTRRQILEAADRALRNKGLLGASTRQIAREAGVADGTLYVHFADRIDLFLALIDEYLPAFVEPLRRLKSRCGTRTVRANLIEVFEASLTWHDRVLPLFSAVAADPGLSQALQRRLFEQNRGPHLSVGAVEAYLKAEQKLGRIHAKADPRATALLLFGASQYWTMACRTVGNDLGYTRDRLTGDVIDGLIAGLQPKKESQPVRLRKAERR
jgi:AcrR family transcriptional regulator